MAVTHSISGPPSDLDLLQPWREPITSRRLLRAGLGSVAVHLVAAFFLLALPDNPAPLHSRAIADVSKSIKLYIPPDLELTQRDPNQGKPSHMVDVRSMHNSAQPQRPHSNPPSPPPGPVAPIPQPVKIASVEAPKIETPKIDVPLAPPALSAAAPKPQAPADRPKLTFEDVTPGPRATQNAQTPPGAVPSPRDALQDALKNPPLPSGAAGSGSIAPSNGARQELRELSPPQLLSDPRGIDFKPYMIQVLSVVRRNWLAILPESARLGRRGGRVIVQFAIDRSGAVPKVVIAEGTGTDSLDRAAVAAISASVPLPPLPADYKGDKISLQFTFSYNMPVR